MREQCQKTRNCMLAHMQFSVARRRRRRRNRAFESATDRFRHSRVSRARARDAERSSENENTQSHQEATKTAKSGRNRDFPGPRTGGIFGQLRTATVLTNAHCVFNLQCFTAKFPSFALNVRFAQLRPPPPKVVCKSRQNTRGISTELAATYVREAQTAMKRVVGCESR